MTLLPVILLALCATGATVLGAEMPPLPPDTPPVHRHHKSAAVVQGAGAKALEAPKIVVPPAPFFVFIWNWLADTNNPSSNVVFIVRSANLAHGITNGCSLASLPWLPVGVTRVQRWTNTINQAASGMPVFSVIASNTVRRLPSGFATR